MTRSTGRSPLRTTAMTVMADGVNGDPHGLADVTSYRLASLDETLLHMPATLQERWFARCYLLMPLVLGVLAALLLRIMLRRHWISDHLQNPFVLMLVVLTFTASNLLHHESGLVAVTVMVLVMANMKECHDLCPLPS